MQEEDKNPKTANLTVTLPEKLLNTSNEPPQSDPQKVSLHTESNIHTKPNHQYSSMHPQIGNASDEQNFSENNQSQNTQFHFPRAHWDKSDDEKKNIKNPASHKYNKKTRVNFYQRASHLQNTAEFPRNQFTNVSTDYLPSSSNLPPSLPPKFLHPSPPHQFFQQSAMQMSQPPMGYYPPQTQQHQTLPSIQPFAPEHNNLLPHSSLPLHLKLQHLCFSLGELKNQISNLEHLNFSIGQRLETLAHTTQTILQYLNSLAAEEEKHAYFYDESFVPQSSMPDNSENLQNTQLNYPYHK